MSLFRSLLLRRMMAVIFLFTGLIAQSQEVFTCQLMGDKPQIVCCCGPPMAAGCEIGGGCIISDGHAATDCCEVNGAKSPSLQVYSPAPSQLLVTLLDGPRPPPGILPPIPIDIAFSRQLLTYSERLSLPAWLLGTRTYLLTHRLRN